MANAMSAPSLPSELIERLLAVAIRAIPFRPGRATFPPALPDLINVLGPQSQFPDISRTAIMRCWWVDLDFASKIGNLDLLCFLDRMSQAYPHRPLQWTCKAMDIASANGFIPVLGWWWRRFGSVCWYSKGAVIGAAERGQLEVVQWWTRMVQRQLVTAFTLSEFESWILSAATKCGHSNICEWWLKNRPKSTKHHRLPLDLLPAALVHALRANDPKFTLFHWWMLHYAPSDHDDALAKIVAWRQLLMDAVKQHGHLNHAAALELPLLLHRLNLLKWTASLCFVCACVADDSTRIVEWLDRLGGGATSGGQPRSKSNTSWTYLNGYQIASETGSIPVLDWLCDYYPLNQSRLRLICSREKLVNKALLGAARNGHLHVLQWWREDSGFPLKSQPSAFAWAASAHPHVLSWLWESQLASEWPQDLLEHAARKNRTFVFEWWTKVYSPVFSLDATSWANVQINQMRRAPVMEWAFSCGSLEVLEWWVNSPWFEHETMSGKMLVAVTQEARPKPGALAWWIESDLVGMIQYEVFASFSWTPYTILLDRYTRTVGIFPECQDDKWWQQVANDKITNAAKRGNTCMLDWWWMRRSQPKPNWDIFNSTCPFPQHVQAWIARHR